MNPARARLTREVIVVALTVAFAFACERARPEPEPAEVTVVPTPAPADLQATEIERTIPIGGPPLVTRATLGRIAESGEAIEAVRTVRRGEPVDLLLELRYAPAGAAARAEWRRHGELVAAQRLAVEPGAPRIRFSVPDTSSWEPGEYEVVAWYGGDEAARVRFAVAEPERRPARPGAGS